MKLANLATAAVFAAFLAAPIGSLALFGPHEMAEKVVTKKELTSAGLFVADDEFRNDVARRLVSNSPVGMDAISAKNSLDFKVFGFINTPQVISGERGWLFYKPGFQDGRCMTDREAGVILGRIEALRVIALGAGIDFRMSVAPDKEVVYPERLGPAAEAAAGCKIVSSRKWRKLADVSGSSVIDHMEVMGHDFTDDLLYFRTDTHWNELGKIRAFRQLVRELTGREISGTIRPNRTVAHRTDMPKGILRIPYAESTYLYDEYIDKELPVSYPKKIPNTLIVHDSSYGVSLDIIKRIFVDPDLINFGNPDLDRKVEEFFQKRPKRIVANTVERYLPQRIGGDLSWSGAVGKAIVHANEEAALECVLTDTARDRLTFTNLDEVAAGDFAARADPQIYIKLAERGRPCVRISFDTSVTQGTFVHLPIRDQINRNGPYFEGFSLAVTNAAGPREIRLLLPEEFAGTTLRIDPIAANGPVSKLKIESGFLPPIETSLAN